MANSSYRPYKKPNDNLIYIHASSNHPPQIIKQLPYSISERLSTNSSSKEIFDTIKGDYEDALKKCGYKSTLNFTQTTKNSKNKRQRKRKIIWFNPPFNKHVTTNVAKIFLKLVDKHFPKTNKLHKIFNRNTIKVSYCCMENVTQIIKGHNKSVTSPKVAQILPCNCRNKSTCPLDGKCRSKSVIYKCSHHT